MPSELEQMDDGTTFRGGKKNTTFIKRYKLQEIGENHYRQQP